MSLYLYAFLAMFCGMFLRGLQNKNVQGGHKKMAGGVGFLMTLLDVLVIHLVVTGGLAVGLAGAVGSGLGWIASMYAHDFMFRKHYEELKLQQKEKLKRRIQKELDKRINN